MGSGAAISLFLLLLLFQVGRLRADDGSLAAKLLHLDKDTRWEEVAQVPLKFNAFHTQGLVKVGNDFFMTSVEVSRWPKAYPQPQGKLDRDEGVGKGHIFRFDKDGNLLADIPVGEGHIYHPGGIDFDGRYIWIPVTEYRPHSFSIVYRLDTQTMKVEEVLRIDDSIGAVAYNRDNHTLMGVNWDARDYYLWDLDKSRAVRKIPRASHYVAYQDCQYVGDHLVLCSGLQNYKTPQGTFRLGGWEIVNLEDLSFANLLPVPLWSPSGAAITNNPCTVESTAKGVRAYFVPDDNLHSVLFVYDAIVQ